MLGLGLGLIYAVAGLVLDVRTTGLNWGTLLAFGAPVGMPAILAAAGFVIGALCGVVVRGVQSVRDRDDRER